MRWLFLRGLAREQRHWGRFPSVFTEVVPGARITCLDLAGAGTERDRDVPLTIAELTDDVRARWLALKNGEPWSLIGISLGGMVALDWCARFPGDFARCAVVNTSASDAGRFWERFSAKGYPRILRTIASADPVERERNIIDLTMNAPGLDRGALAERHAEYARTSPMRRASVLRQLLAAARSRAPRKVETPLLVVSSRADRLVSHRCSERIAARLGAPLVLHETAGHDLPADDPEWLAEQVGRWAAI